MTAATPGSGGESLRVLCIAGSPRRGGNSEQLLDSLMAGVEGEGGRAIKLVATDAGVRPCRGCNACSRTGTCIQRDGMDAVHEELDAADAIVVATPVYFATVPAVLKIIFDRCQPYWARRYVLGGAAPATKRPGGILVVGGGGDPFGTACAVTAVRSVFAVLGVASDDVLECVGPDAARDITNHPDELQRALARGAQIVAAARAQGPASHP